MTTTRLLLTLAAMLMSCVSMAQPGSSPWNNPWNNAYGNQRRWPVYRRWPAPSGQRWFGSAPQGFNQHARSETSHTDSGFVVVDAKEIQPPFELKFEDGKVSVNGHKVCKVERRLPTRQAVAMMPGMFNGQPPVMNEILSTLNDGGMLVVSGSSHCLLPAKTTVDALTILVSNRSAKRKLKKLANLSDVQPSALSWEELLTAFQPGDALEERLNYAAALLHATSGRYRYARRVLLVSGLLLATLGIGFLVLFRPASNGVARTPELLSRTVLVSILLLLAMNIYDLVATVYTCVPGGLSEMNKLVHPLVQTPLMMSLVKLAAVGAGCFAIWWFRERKIASFAAWWLGLAYTVLIFHWSVCQYILLA